MAPLLPSLTIDSKPGVANTDSGPPTEEGSTNVWLPGKNTPSWSTPLFETWTMTYCDSRGDLGEATQ